MRELEYINLETVADPLARPYSLAFVNPPGGANNRDKPQIPPMGEMAQAAAHRAKRAKQDAARRQRLDTGVKVIRFGQDGFDAGERKRLKKQGITKPAKALDRATAAFAENFRRTEEWRRQHATPEAVLKRQAELKRELREEQAAVRLAEKLDNARDRAQRLKRNADSTKEKKRLATINNSIERLETTFEKTGTDDVRQNALALAQTYDAHSYLTRVYKWQDKRNEVYAMTERGARDIKLSTILKDGQVQGVEIEKVNNKAFQRLLGERDRTFRNRVTGKTHASDREFVEHLKKDIEVEGLKGIGDHDEDGKFTSIAEMKQVRTGLAAEISEAKSIGLTGPEIKKMEQQQKLIDSAIAARSRDENRAVPIIRRHAEHRTVLDARIQYLENQKTALDAFEDRHGESDVTKARRTQIDKILEGDGKLKGLREWREDVTTNIETLEKELDPDVLAAHAIPDGRGVPHFDPDGTSAEELELESDD